MASATNPIPIDPQLLNGDRAGAIDDTTPAIHLAPVYDASGTITTSKASYEAQLNTQGTKKPLRNALSLARPGTQIPKSWTLDRLRRELLDHWYPSVAPRPHTTIAESTPSLPPSHGAPTVDVLQFAVVETENGELPFVLAHHDTETCLLANITSDPDDEVNLVREFGANVQGVDTTELLGYDVDEEDEEDGNGGIDEGDESGEHGSFEAFQTSVRLDAVQRAEQTRRVGGIKTQDAMVRLWNEFRDDALSKGLIKDGIVDEHAILLCIKYHAERPKRTPRGVEIPGTFVGASQLKKLFFALLRIRKEQDAREPLLASLRPATSVVVWDEIKARMDIALRRAHSGLVPGEDAPDITANTFLAEITDEQLESIGKGFLSHRELRSVIYGHLAWTTQNASGNRGDDIRALRLAELQPWTMLHPNNETKIPCVLGLQSEEKAGKRGMRTVINPVYTVWIAHRQPELCPLGAIAILHHYLHDVKGLVSADFIDWQANSTWRGVRVLSGPKSPTTPLSDASLYNLYVRAFTAAGFVSRIKAHLPRHLLGFRQEAMGVDPADTSQLGWVRGQTYFDTYRPSIAKAAVLGAHGFKTHEVYDPSWRDVHVPEQFLRLVCPMAEEICDSLTGRANLTGATNYWKMIIQLRPYFFQCGAAIYQLSPQSALFRLPAFMNRDVRTWMVTTFRTELAVLMARDGSLIDRQRLENTLLQRSLEDVRSVMASQNTEIKRLSLLLERRTAVMSPTRGFSLGHYHNSASSSQSPVPPPPLLPSASLDFGTHQRADSGTYTQSDGSLRAFANASPRSVDIAREPTQVDLVLPPAAAFYDKDEPQGIWPPCLGQSSVRWSTVFPLIKQPHLCWEVWKPSKTLNQYSTVAELWDIYILGEPVVVNGIQTGVRPPLRDVNQFFQHRWRVKGASNQKKVWQRFREIPEWIDKQSSDRQVPPTIVISELEAMRIEPIPGTDNSRIKGIRALTDEIELCRKSMANASVTQAPLASPFSAANCEASPETNARPAKRSRAPAVGARIRAKRICI